MKTHLIIIVISCIMGLKCNVFDDFILKVNNHFHGFVNSFTNDNHKVPRKVSDKLPTPPRKVSDKLQTTPVTKYTRDKIAKFKDNYDSKKTTTDYFISRKNDTDPNDVTPVITSNTETSIETNADIDYRKLVFKLTKTIESLYDQILKCESLNEKERFEKADSLKNALYPTITVLRDIERIKKKYEPERQLQDLKHRKISYKIYTKDGNGERKGRKKKVIVLKEINMDNNI